MRRSRLPELISFFPLPLHLIRSSQVKLILLLSMPPVVARFKAVLRFFLGRSSSRDLPTRNGILSVRERQGLKNPEPELPPHRSRSMHSKKVPGVERPTRYRRASSVSFISIPPVPVVCQ
ncbi:hypothetical protein B0H11DRAFT_2039849 [Mycena galericulata]|nr:hypothetical protein B0H11DRAFT_2039849 [Mycena galericulata]